MVRNFGKFAAGAGRYLGGGYLRTSGKMLSRASDISHPKLTRFSRRFVCAEILRACRDALTVVTCIALVLAPTASYAQQAVPRVAPGSINIVPDGRTKTNVATSGVTANITTSTVSGPNAFNSF